MTSYDEIAVRRALWGEKVKLTHPERIVATRRLTERGYTGTEIAGMLGVSDRTVTRLRNLDFDPSIADEGTIDAPSKEERRHLLDGAVPAAIAMANHVREDDPRVVWSELGMISANQLKTLVVTLAAMVPVDDCTPQELLAWTDHLVDEASAS